MAKRHLKDPGAWNCEYCESKDLQEKRNCDWEQKAECQRCGPIAFEDAYTDPGKSVFMCPKCNRRVKFPGEFMLGDTFRTPGCPIFPITELSRFLVSLVHWSEETGKLPSATTLLDESLLYFEIRNIVISERSIAEEELTSKEKTKSGTPKRS